MAYHDALLLKDTGSLSKGEREMIIVVTSAANQCLYCVVAHGAILRVYEKKPLVADQVAPRFQETVTVSLAGVHVAGLTLRSRSLRSAVLAIAAWLNWPPFDE